MVKIKRAVRFWLIGCGLAACVPLGQARDSTETSVATFSIVACDTAHGEWGVAVASRFLGVGAVVPWSQAGVGALATQAVANTRFGPNGLKLLSADYSAPQALQRLLDLDGRREIRQVGMVDRHGGSATHTGVDCEEIADGILGPGFAVQGNSLANPRILEEMVDAFQRYADRPLAERLLFALEAGEEEGGDRRGKQAAALLVTKKRGGYGGNDDRYVDLRVDDHENPVAELRRIYELDAKTLLPATHIRLGDEAAAEGRLEKANEEYARAITLYRDAVLKFPDDPKPSNALAWFYVKHKMNLDEAWAMARKAYEMDPDSWEVLDTLAELYFATGKAGKAHQAALAALNKAPSNNYLQKQEQRFRDAVAAAENH